MQLKGYEVRITCNGKTLPEYSVRPEDDGSTLVCFVPSESSKVRHFLPFPLQTKRMNGRATKRMPFRTSQSSGTTTARRHTCASCHLSTGGMQEATGVHRGAKGTGRASA